MLITAKNTGNFNVSDVVVGVLYNNPWAFLFTVPAALMGLNVFSYRNKNFLVAVRELIAVINLKDI